MKRADKAIKTGKLENAEKMLLSVTRDYPEADRAWQLLGQCYRKEKQFSKAEYALRVAISKEPKSVESNAELGSVLYDEQKYPEAEAQFRSAIELMASVLPTRPCWLARATRWRIGPYGAGLTLPRFQTNTMLERSRT